MTDDIVQRLLTEKVYCEACHIYPCIKRVGMFNVNATPADCDCGCHEVERAAADEIERLRTANRNLLHTIERLGDQMLEGEARRD